MKKKADAYVNNKDWEALEEFSVDLLDDSKGKSAAAFYLLGLAFYNLSFFREAATAFEKSIEIDKKDPQKYYNLGMAYFKL